MSATTQEPLKHVPTQAANALQIRKRKRTTTYQSSSLTNTHLPVIANEPVPPLLPLEITPTERITISTYLISHPSLSPYTPTLTLSSELSNSTVNAAVSLVALTSSVAYASSTKGWSSRAKRKEMLENGMRFLVLRPPRSSASLMDTSDTTRTGRDAAASDVQAAAEAEAKYEELTAFLSYLPVYETDPDALPSQPRALTALYIYEIHVHPSYRGHQLGTCMMHLAHELARSLQVHKTMLTVFCSNVGARRLYERLGYVFWDEEFVEAVRRRLRSGVKEEVRRPDYVILGRDVWGRAEAVEAEEKDRGGGDW